MLIEVIYSSTQARVRRIIVPDSEEQLSDPSWVGKGEAMLTYDAGDAGIIVLIYTPLASGGVITSLFEGVAGSRLLGGLLSKSCESHKVTL